MGDSTGGPSPQDSTGGSGGSSPQDSTAGRSAGTESPRTSTEAPGFTAGPPRANSASPAGGQRPSTKTAKAKSSVRPNPVRVDRAGPVTTVILDRPEVRNAVDGPTAAALAEAFADFDADTDAAVAVLFGAGGTFCAGADLKAMGSDRGNKTTADGQGPMGPTRMRLSKPVIAAVAGYAVAGGLELALWCDLRVVEETATFGVFSRRWGVPLIDGGTVRLPQIIGASRALDLILTGRAVPAAEAYEMGLATRIVPAGHAREAAEQLARQIASFPQQCLRSDRASALDSLSLGYSEAMANEFQHGMGTLVNPGVFEGVSRFRGGAGRGGAPA
jgi:enoyl-CoA hydratase